MRDGGGREGENRRGAKLLIDFEGEEKVEENKDVKEACDWELGGGDGAVKRKRRVTGAGQRGKKEASR